MVEKFRGLNASWHLDSSETTEIHHMLRAVHRRHYKGEKSGCFFSPFVGYFRPIKSIKGTDSLSFAIICRIFHLIRYFFSSNWMFNQMMKICIFAKFPWQYLKCYESVSFPVKAHFICILKTKFRLPRIRNGSNRKYSFRFLFKPMVLVFGIIASVCSEWS